MPGNRKLTLKTIRGKEGLHPGSRKAGQLDRVHLRTAKLSAQTKARRDYASAKRGSLISSSLPQLIGAVARPVFFLHSLSSAAPLSLPSLRALIADVFLTRNDERIAELTKERRAGRPKGKELLEMEELRRREWSEWATGLEIPDLTHGPTVRLMYTWLESDTPIVGSHIDLLRQVRIAKDESVALVVSKPGRTETMGLGGELRQGAPAEEWAEGAMQVEA
ncbi:translation machinery-associated protein 16, partial [Tremellales sp. Uapishka_1]